MSKAKVLELKHIAKMLNSHRDEAIEKRFVDSLLAITVRKSLCNLKISDRKTFAKTKLLFRNRQIRR